MWGQCLASKGIKTMPPKQQLPVDMPREPPYRASPEALEGGAQRSGDSVSVPSRGLPACTPLLRPLPQTWTLYSGTPCPYQDASSSKKPSLTASLWVPPPSQSGLFFLQAFFPDSPNPVFTCLCLVLLIHISHSVNQFISSRKARPCVVFL